MISGYYGFSNAGDEAVLAGMVASLRKLVPRVRIIALSGDPEATARQHGIDSVDRSRLGIVSEVIRNCDLFLSGGGSLLQDVTSALSPLYYLNLLRLGLSLHKPVMIYAQGFGPLRRPVNRILARRYLNRVSVITVRDADSAEALRTLGVCQLPIRVTADPAFCLEVSRAEAPTALLNEVGLAQGEGPLIGIALRPWQGMREVSGKIAAVLSNVRAKTGCRYLFLSMQFPQDREAMRDISTQLGSESMIEKSLTPQDLLALTGQVNLVVAMRLHALIFAAAQTVPMVALGYDPKVASLCQSLGQPVVAWEQAVGELEAAILAALNSLGNLKKILEGRLGTLREGAMENAKIAASLITRSATA